MPYFFKDGKKTIDFVIVYNVYVTRKQIILSRIEYFLANLEKQGFKLEVDKYAANENISFIKIYGPDRVLRRFAQVFSIVLECETTDFRPIPKKPPFKFMATILTDSSISSDEYQRAPESISGTRPQNITSGEKALIIYKVLNQTAFGEERSQFGMGKLIRSRVFECAYPIHDGIYQWQDEGPLNDRQLLSKYWSSIRCFYKEQPLNLIQKYYGPQFAFYSAWLGFYNKMLIPASLIGVVCFIIGISSFMDDYYVRTKEICESDKVLCPRCFVEGCKYEYLRSSCLNSYLVYFFDNPFTVTFAALMSVWSTIFMELWHRHELILQIRWNLRSVEIDTSSFRPEFEDGTKYRKISSVTGNLEPYVPIRVLICKYTFTCASILFLMTLVLLGILGVWLYSITIYVVIIKASAEPFVVQYVQLIASFTASLISVAFILIFELIYDRLALWLTNLENPRTQIDFDNSYAYKCFALACVNYYAATFYIAFFKGNFYTHPGDEKMRSGLGLLKSDLCDPSGCIINLGMQMFVIMIAKSIISNFQQFILPFAKICFTGLFRKRPKKLSRDQSWEEDYELNPIQHDHYVKEYIQMTIQYGFVIFFAASFPLTPLLALVNNLVEMRIDAYKLTRQYRRPIPFKTPNIGAWNGILQGITYAGVVTNAFVIAFTSEFVQRETYRYTVNSSLEGFAESTLSSFDVQDFEVNFGKDEGVCYYPGYRYPPDSTHKYQLTRSYWNKLALKFITVVVFEHIMMFIAGMVAYAIPDIPFSVKNRINHDERMSKDLENKRLSQAYMKTLKKTKRNDKLKIIDENLEM